MKGLKYIIIVLLLIGKTLYAQNNEEYNYEFALVEAARQKSIGNISDALNLYLKCLEVKPESSAVPYEIGSIYAATGRTKEALPYLEDAYSKQPDNYWYMLAYLEGLRLNKEYKTASKILKKFLKNNEDSKLQFSLADIYTKQGKEKKALDILNNIESKYGISERIIFKKIEVYKSRNEYARGEKEIKKLIQIVPEAPEYRIIMAEYLNETGQKEKAMVYFRSAYELDSTNLYAVTNLADYYINNSDYTKGFYYLSKAFALPQIKLENKLKSLLFYVDNNQYTTEYFNEIDQLFITLEENYPDNQQIKRIRYDFYFKTAHFEEAFDLIKEILETDKESYPIWQQAIYNASLINRFEDIIALVDEARKIFPNKKDLLLFKGIALYQKNEFEESYKTLKENYEIGFNMDVQLQYLTFLGESAYKTNRISEAWTYFDELLLLDPNNIIVLNNYSYYLSLQEERLNDAEKMSRKTIEAEPENPVYLDTYAWILHKLGRNTEALEYIEKAMQQSQDPDVIFHYAEILCTLGMNEKAVTNYLLAKEKGYNPEEIEKKISICQ